MNLQHYPYQLLAKWIADDPEAWIALGNIETRMLARNLLPVASPVYVTGLARAGTTILTEAIASHPEIATHTYRDFPCIFTPYIWNRLLGVFDWVPHRSAPQERAHKDGIMVTPQSPEAMEEALWMAFFKQLHDENHPAVLGPQTSNPAFAAFYREHIQKLLHVRKKPRYAAKANYNITRIAYILSLFPDAQFVIVVRHPEALVWSLYQKDILFCAEQERDPATLTHMDRAGHFEFGKHRTLIHTGDDAAIASIQTCFADGDDIRAWARYWAMMHAYIKRVSSVSPNILIVRHEDLCQAPHAKMQEIFTHCQLDYNDAMLNASAGNLREAKMPTLSEEVRAVICEETKSAAQAFDYSFR